MLIFRVKKEWFKKIKEGKKTHEYREVKPYWTSRIMKHLYHEYITNEDYFIAMCNGGVQYFKPLSSEFLICNGYSSKEDKGKSLKAKLKRISIVYGKNTDLKINKPVFDIEFELIKNKKGITE